MATEQGQFIMTPELMKSELEGLRQYFQNKGTHPAVAVVIMQEMCDMLVEQLDIQLTTEVVEKDSIRHREVERAIEESKKGMN